VTPPAAAAGAPVTRARTTAPARPRVAPPRPRRISGPVRPPAKRAAPRAQSHAQAERGLVPGLLEALDGVSRSGALDRLIRGRIWIGVITFALIGIVTLQLLVLQLNASIGRSLVREAQLQRANAALSIENSELAGGERVETQAAHLGMQLVTAGALRFLTGNPRAYVARAAAALKAPPHAASSEGVASSATASTATASTATSGATAGTASEHSPTGETGTTPAPQSITPTEQAAPSATPSSAQTSEAPAPNPSGSSSAPSSATGGGAPTSSEAASGAAVGGAGAAGSGQPNGGG
jgi:hypothetical protein